MQEIRFQLQPDWIIPSMRLFMVIFCMWKMRTEFTVTTFQDLTGIQPGEEMVTTVPGDPTN